MIGLSALGVFREDVASLTQLAQNCYENIFRMYPTEDPNTKPFLYYNLLNSIYIPTPLQSETYYTITLNRIMPWTVISYDEYKTMNLWWLIVLANNIYNPIIYPPAGTRLNIIKPNFVPGIINNINVQLKQ
jgi:hypothetical protein